MNFLDMVASDESPSQISDKIKELLFLNLLKELTHISSEVASAVVR